MSADSQTNQYVITLAAGEDRYNVTASFTHTKTKRAFFQICVTGPNPIRYRWDTKVQNEGGDMPLGTGEKDVYRDPCPQGRIAVSAPGGATTIAIIETIAPRGARPPSGVVG